MVNSPLIRPYFLGGGGIGGVPLDSPESNHSRRRWFFKVMPLVLPHPFRWSGLQHWHGGISWILDRSFLCRSNSCDYLSTGGQLWNSFGWKRWLGIAQVVWKSQESRPKKKVLKESQSAFLFCGYRIPTHFFFHPPWPEQKWCVQFPVCLQQKSLPRFEFPSFSPPKQRDGHLDLENFANLTTVRIQGSMWRPWWSWIIPMNHPIIVAFAPWVIGYLLKVFPESTAWIQGPLPRSFDSILLFGKKQGRLGGWMKVVKACCRFLEYSWNW